MFAGPVAAEDNSAGVPGKSVAIATAVPFTTVVKTSDPSSFDVTKSKQTKPATDIVQVDKSSSAPIDAKASAGSKVEPEDKAAVVKKVAKEGTNTASNPASQTPLANDDFATAPATIAKGVTAVSKTRTLTVAPVEIKIIATAQASKEDAPVPAPPVTPAKPIAAAEQATAVQVTVPQGNTKDQTQTQTQTPPQAQVQVTNWAFDHISYYYAVVSHTNSVKYWKCC